MKCKMSLSKLIGGFVIFYLLGLPSIVLADDYYTQHGVGWHWYDDPKEAQLQSINPDPKDPVEQMKTVKLALQRALDTAVLNPTPQNVQNYIMMQNQISDRASHFARVWQWVLLQNPKMDYSIQHPTNQLGRQIYLDQQGAQQDAAIYELAKHSGLFFFYRSQCPYCERFAPILKHFSEHYGIAVIAITLDGVALPEFPQSRVDSGQAVRFRVIEEPALFTVNPYTHKVIPVSYGLISENDLRTRILDIATNFKGDD